MPRGSKRLASVGTDRGQNLSAASRSDLPPGTRRPRDVFPRRCKDLCRAGSRRGSRRDHRRADRPMSKLVISTVGPASSVQDGGRHGAQRYGLTPSGAVDRLAVATASGLVGNDFAVSVGEASPLGAADGEFGADGRTVLLGSEWKISATRDRMGYRLEGPIIKHLHGHNIVSDGTVDGSIQVPGNGAPIVLMPDRGTSGGYPKIATVISADLGHFAQTPALTDFPFTTLTTPA